MQLTIDHEPREFIPIRDFRAQYNLPLNFGIQLFMAGDTSAQGRFQRHRDEVQLARQDVLDALPENLPLQGWVAFLPHLMRLFTDKLHEINAHLEMNREEVEQTIVAFNQVCQRFIYARIQDGAAPQMEAVYMDWLNRSVKIAPETHSYIHMGAVWAVQIVSHALGPCGLVVWTDNGTHYVLDNLFTCPAEPFMVELLYEISRSIPAG